MRDGQQALAFGRPLLIQDADCDVEPMDELDFSEDGIDQIDAELFSRFTRQHILYSINMMRFIEWVQGIPVKYLSYFSDPDLYGYRSLQGQRYISGRGQGPE